MDSDQHTDSRDCHGESLTAGSRWVVCASLAAAEPFLETAQRRDSITDTEVITAADADHVRWPADRIPAQIVISSELLAAASTARDQFGPGAEILVPLPCTDVSPWLADGLTLVGTGVCARLVPAGSAPPSQIDLRTASELLSLLGPDAPSRLVRNQHDLAAGRAERMRLDAQVNELRQQLADAGAERVSLTKERDKAKRAYDSLRTSAVGRAAAKARSVRKQISRKGTS